MKKILCLLLAGLMFVSVPTSAFAAEKSLEEVSVQLNEDKQSDLVIVEKELSDNKSRASWGKGQLYSENPLLGHPWAYGVTVTYSGTAYKLYAQTVCIDDESLLTKTEKAYASNSESATSARITSATEGCSFTGYHGLQDTSTSGWQTCETYKSYY